MSVLFKSIVNGFVISRNVDPIGYYVDFFCVCARDLFISERPRDRYGSLTISIGCPAYWPWYFRVVRYVGRNAAFVANAFLLIAIVRFAPFNFRVWAFLGAVEDSENVFVITMYVPRFVSIISL